MHLLRESHRALIFFGLSSISLASETTLASGWQKRCEGLLSQTAANGLEQWEQRTDPRLTPLVARYSVDALAASEPAVGELAGLLGMSEKILTPSSSATYRANLQAWVDRTIPGWTLAWPDELAILAQRRAGTGSLSALSSGDLLWRSNAFLHPLLHAELISANRIPLLSANDLLSQLVAFTKPRFRAVMRQRALFLLKWLRPELVNLKVRLSHSEPFTSVDEDNPVAIALSLLLNHLLSDVRHSSYDNLPLLMTSGREKHFAWHGQYTYDLVAALSHSQDTDVAIANLILGRSASFPAARLPRFSDFRIKERHIVEGFQNSLVLLGKTHDGFKQKLMPLHGMVAELREENLIIPDRELAVEQFLSGLAKRLGHSPVDSLLDYNNRIGYAESALALYESYLSWLSATETP